MTVARKESTRVNKIERAGGIVISLLLIYRILIDTHLDFFILSSFSLLAVYYLWFGFFIFTNARPSDLTDRGKRSAFTPFKISVSILMGAVYSICLIAILYAIFFYQQMQLMLVLSLLCILAGTGFAVIYARLKQNNWLFVKQFIIRSSVLGSFILLLVILPVETKLNILYRKHPHFIEAYKEYRQNPESDEALERLRSERSRFR